MTIKTPKKTGVQAGRFYETNTYGRNFGPNLELDGLGGGGGTPPGGAPPAGDPPAFDAAAFQSEMKDFVVKAVNGAVSTHLTRALDSKFEANNTALLEQIQGLIPAPPTAGDPPPSGGGSDLDAAIKNATAPLMKQLEEQRSMNERNAATAKAEREGRMHQEETSALGQALTKFGVAGPLAAAAVNLLHGSLDRESDGSMVYVSKESGPTGPYDERVSIEEGVKRYLGTEDGKHFLPARPVGGAGNRGGGAPSANPGQETDGQMVGRMLEHLGM